MTTRLWIRAVLFWAMMLTLAFIWLGMHDMGRGSGWKVFVGFGPLIVVVILFLFVLVLECALRRRRRGSIGKGKV